MIHELYDHMAWADSVVWRAVLSAPAAENDQKVRELLLHLHLVQHAFLTIWRGDPPAYPDPAAFPDLRSIADWGRRYHAEVDINSHGDPERVVDLPWSGRLTKQFGRVPEQTTLAQTQMQVAMHSSYHRGQINMRLRELGVAPPLVDFIAWLWIGRPAPEWPVSA